MNHLTCSLCLTSRNHGGCACLSEREPRELLTDADVLARLHGLAAYVDTLDTESAHKAEDGLSLVVFRAIAEGTCPDPQAAARTMVALLSTDRERWFA